MAKYTITHSCGHQATHQLIGPHKRRDWIISQREGEDCPECEKAAREKRNAEASAAAKEVAQAAGLPQLTGSEKQIAWAETIRASFKSAQADAARAATELRAGEQLQVGQLATALARELLSLIHDDADFFAGRAVVGRCLGDRGYKAQEVDPAAMGEIGDLLDAVAADMIAATESRFWIDARDNLHSAFMSRFMKRFPLACPTAAAILASVPAEGGAA